MRKALILMCTAVFVSACQSEPEEPAVTETVQEDQSEAVSDRVTRMRSQAGEAPVPTEQEQLGDPERDLPRLQGQFAQPGMGLANLVDGTSPQAFSESLQRIAAETSSDQYRELDSSLRYLRMYSSAAWGGLPGLYESLDSMTGEEIIAHARRLQAERRTSRTSDSP